MARITLSPRLLYLISAINVLIVVFVGGLWIYSIASPNSLTAWGSGTEWVVLNQYHGRAVVFWHGYEFWLPTPGGSTWEFGGIASSMAPVETTLREGRPLWMMPHVDLKTAAGGLTTCVIDVRHWHLMLGPTLAAGLCLFFARRLHPRRMTDPGLPDLPDPKNRRRRSKRGDDPIRDADLDPAIEVLKQQLKK